MTMTRLTISLVILASLCTFLSGCGGSGGTTSATQPLALSGSVTDVAGNLVPGAEIRVDRQLVTKSLMNGTYRVGVNDAASGPHNVEATAVIDGVTWNGSLAVNVYSSGPAQNMNIVIGRWNSLGGIRGRVTDASGRAIPDARVFAIARFPGTQAATDASVISKAAVSDQAGNYDIQDMPVSVTVGGSPQSISYDISASSVGATGQSTGFKNSTTHNVGLTANSSVTANFTLEVATNIVPSVPPGWTASGALAAMSYTVANSIVSRADQSAYDAVKASISPRSSKFIAARRRTVGRSAPDGSLIENDISWQYTWTNYFGSTIPVNLAGFSIYRATSRPAAQKQSDLLDFSRDPSLVTYADPSDVLTPGVTYYYAVSAVSTSYLDASDQFNPAAESALCYGASVTPLSKLAVLSPASGASQNGSPTFSWQPLSGAGSYRVYIYQDYPIFDALFTPQGDPNRPDHLPAWEMSEDVRASSVTYSANTFVDRSFSLVPGHTYYWVVIASDASNFVDGSAYAISELRYFTVR